MPLDFDMEKIVRDLKNIMPFKETTVEGDIVLIVADQLVYALVTDISRDHSKRDEWWHVTMQVFTVPPKEIVWTLREPQFTGQEIFTMGGEKRFVKALDLAGGKKPGGESKGTVRLKKKPVLKVIK